MVARSAGAPITRLKPGVNENFDFFLRQSPSVVNSQRSKPDELRINQEVLS